MTNDKVWLTHSMSIFYYVAHETENGLEDFPYVCLYAGLQSIEFCGASKTCSYCGHDYDGIECPGCSARMKSGSVFHAGKAIAKIAGLMPQSEWLTNPPSRIDVVFVECGRPDVYTNAKDIIYLSECKLKKSVIEFSSEPWKDDIEVVVYSEIECIVKIEHKPAK